MAEVHQKSEKQSKFSRIPFKRVEFYWKAALSRSIACVRWRIRHKKQTFGITNTSAIEIEDLCCDHEEADTRMILHCRHVVLSSETENVVVWSPDTDVAILLAYHFEDLGCTQLWFRTGVADKARFIPIHQICSNLGKEICRILVGFHALTGCDSTSGFAGIGKVKAFKVLKKSLSSYYDLKTLADDINISEESIYKLQQFVCHLYMQTYKDSDIDNLRHKLSCQKRAKNESLPPMAIIFVWMTSSSINFCQNVKNKILFTYL